MEAVMKTVFPGSVRQLGFVVENLDQAIGDWFRSFGLGPWFVTREFGYSRFNLRGREVRPKVAIAISYSGDTQIELIQQLDDEDSMYLEFLRAGRLGLQHVAYWSQDVQACLCDAQAVGWSIGQSIETPRGPVYYLENGGSGVVVEIAGLTPERTGTFEAVRAECAGWDGIELTREYWPA